jgi:hypothetical protein
MQVGRVRSQERNLQALGLNLREAPTPSVDATISAHDESVLQPCRVYSRRCYH